MNSEGAEAHKQERAAQKVIWLKLRMQRSKARDDFEEVG